MVHVFLRLQSMITARAIIPSDDREFDFSSADLPALQSMLADILISESAVDIQLPGRRGAFRADAESLRSPEGRKVLERIDDLAFLAMAGIDVILRPGVSGPETLPSLSSIFGVGGSVVESIRGHEPTWRAWGIYEEARYGRGRRLMIPEATLNSLIEEEGKAVHTREIYGAIRRMEIRMHDTTFYDLCFHRSPVLGEGRYEELFGTDEPIAGPWVFAVEGRKTRNFVIPVHNAALLLREIIEQDYIFKRWMGTSEVAAALGHEEPWVARLAMDGKIPSRLIHFGGYGGPQRRYRPEDIEAVLRDRAGARAGKESGKKLADAEKAEQETRLSEIPDESQIRPRIIDYLSLSVEARIEWRISNGLSSSEVFKSFKPELAVDPHTPAEAARRWDAGTATVEKMLEDPKTRKFWDVYHERGGTYMIPAFTVNRINRYQKRLLPVSRCLSALRRAGIKTGKATFSHVLEDAWGIFGMDREHMLEGLPRSLIVRDLRGRLCVDFLDFARVASLLHIEQHMKDTWDTLPEFIKKTRRSDRWCYGQAETGAIKSRTIRWGDGSFSISGATLVAPGEASRQIREDSILRKHSLFIPSRIFPDYAFEFARRLSAGVSRSIPEHTLEGSPYRNIRMVLRAQRVEMEVSASAAAMIWGTSDRQISHFLEREDVRSDWGAYPVVRGRNRTWRIPPDTVNRINRILKTSISIACAQRLLTTAVPGVNSAAFREMIENPCRCFLEEDLLRSGLTAGPLYFEDPFCRVDAHGEKLLRRMDLLTFARLVRLLRRRNADGQSPELPAVAGELSDQNEEPSSSREQRIPAVEAEEDASPVMPPAPRVAHHPETSIRSTARKAGVADSEPEPQQRERDYASSEYEKLARSYSLLEVAEERRLLRLVAQGAPEESTHARQELVLHNLRLVISIARGYMGRGLDLHDLIMEGNQGLDKAVERYRLDLLNPKTGEPYRFSTYATHWIRQTVSRAVHDHSRIIRLPVHKHEALQKIRQTSALLSSRLQRDPTPEEVAGAVDMKPEEVGEILMYGEAVYSLDAPAGKDEKNTLGDFAATHVDDLTEVHSSIMRDSIEKAFEIVGLSERQREVLRLRFGISNGGVPLTLEEVGHIYEVTRERVRQIEAKALKKLQSSGRARSLLKDFLDDM